MSAFRNPALPKLLASALLACCPFVPVIAQESADFTPAALQALPAQDWRTNGGNLFNQRYSPLSVIDRSNVAQLKGVWHVRTNSRVTV